MVVFPKRLRYFLNVDAGCLNGVAGIAISDVQRATAGASTSTAKAAPSGGVLFVHRFGATLNAHVHLYLCMLAGVVVPGRQGLAFRGAQVDDAWAARVQGRVRQRVLGLVERRGLLSREMVAVMQGWGTVAVFLCMRACGSQRRIGLGVSGCCDIVRVRCLPVSGWYGREAGRRCATGCSGRR